MLMTYCQREGVDPITNITPDTDCRDPRVRREVFMYFYEYHLALRAHPGCVYFILPYLAKRFNWTQEQYLWFCYINGCTQNPLTSWMIFREFPDFENLDFVKLETWHRANWRNLAYDTDRRYQKGHFVQMACNYKTLIEQRAKTVGGNTQWSFFNNLDTKDPTDAYHNFNSTWDIVRNRFHMFGRLSTFSYLEYLRIAGLNINCPHLFLEDMDGSKSHRNGLLKVSGLDEWEEHKTINPGVKHTKEVVEFTKIQGTSLLQEAQKRFRGRDFEHDVNYFTLESTLCTFKGWFRKDRRYPNVYIDMMFDRMMKAKELGIGDDIKIFT